MMEGVQKILSLLLSAIFVLFIFYTFWLYFYGIPKIVYSSLKQIKKPTKKDRILFLAPHPDDESLGCFGYMYKAIKAGAKVMVVVLTDGKFTAKSEIRYAETIKTLSEVGLSKKNIFFLGFKDIGLGNANYCSEILKKMILSFKPTIIFSTSNHDFNPDHRATYFHLKEALKDIKFNGKVYYYLIHYNLKNYPIPGGFKPNKNLYPPLSLLKEKLRWLKLILTKKELLLKQKAIINYKSQLRMKLFLTRKTLFSFIRKNELFYEEKSL